MKKILFLLLLIPFFAVGQPIKVRGHHLTIIGSGGVGGPGGVGNVDMTSFSLGSFTVLKTNGTWTPTIDGSGHMIIDNSPNYSDSNMVSLNGIEDNNEKYRETMEFTLPDITSFGPGVGTFTTSAAFPMPNPTTSRWDQGHNALALLDGVARNSVTPGITAVVGHSYRLTYERTKDSSTTTIKDLTTASTVYSTHITCNLSSGTQGGNFFPTSTHRLVMLAYGNKMTVTRFKYEDLALMNADLIVMGNSKTYGSNSGGLQFRFAQKLQDSTGHVVEVWAGNGDEIADMRKSIPAIIAHHPRAVMLVDAMRNDKANAVDSAVYEGNYSYCVSQLKASGIRVIHMCFVPEGHGAPGSSTATWSSWIKTTYGNTDLVIDPVAGGFDPSSMVGADFIHPNSAGHSFLYRQIKTALGW